MTVKELKNAIADAMQTMKENKHTCTRAEKEIITAQYTKKADLENQLETMRTVIERNEKRRAAAEKATAEKTPAKKTSSKPAASLKKSSSKVDKQTTADKPKTAAKKSSTAKKTTTEKPEPEPERKWYPDNYETENNVFTKLAQYDATGIENGTVLIGRYFDIKHMTKNMVYSAKEKAIQKLMEKMQKAGENPFPENIDLYQFVTMNNELYVIQSIITSSFTSLRKDELQKAVEADHVGLYTMEAKSKKTTGKKTTTAAKKTPVKKTPAKKTATK